MNGERRPPIFYALAVLLGLFLIFLYGPIATIVLLSFQGPEGGLVFPMNGLSLHWFAQLFQPQPMQAPPKMCPSRAQSIKWLRWYSQTTCVLEESR